MRTLLSHFTRFLQQSVLPRKYLLLVLLCFVGYSFAAGEQNDDSDMIDAIVQVMNLIFGILTMLLTPAIIMAGWLLSPDWTMGDFFGLRPYFIQVWVLVSNVVYIIFALMLLYMAVMQIFSGESNYAFKKKLPRFLVGIMMVPFTWLIVSWTLSFANQAVAAVLSIPMGAIVSMQDPDTQTAAFHTRVIPTKFTFAFGWDAWGGDPKSLSCGDNGETEDKVKCISPAEFIRYNQSGPFFIILIYAYDIFKVQKTDMAKLTNACGGKKDGSVDARNCIKNLEQLARKFGVSLITTVFFAILLIALCWVLLARAFKLWIYVMFSPLFGLAYAVSDEGLGKTFQSEWGWGGHGGGAKLGELGFVPFFKLAMVPVLVSAVLAFGLLFIGVIKNTFTSGNLEQTTSGTFCTGDKFMVKYCLTEDKSKPEWYSSRLIIGTDKTNAAANKGSGDYAITFEFGSMLSDFIWNSEGKTVTEGAKGVFDATEDIFAHIILSIIALAIIWMGVKAAVQYDEVTKMAFEPFAKFGDSVGNFVQHIPSYLPTPHPAFAAANPATWEGIGAGINKNVDSAVTDSRNNMQDMLSGAAGRTSAAAENFKNDVGSFGDFVKQFWNELHKDVKVAKESLLVGLDKAESKVPEADKVKFNAFRNAVNKAKTNEDMKEVLSKDPEINTHADIVAKLESGQIGWDTFKGHLVQLGTMFGASAWSSSSSATGSFAGNTIAPDGTIKSPADRTLNSGDMTPAQKEKIKSIFPKQSNIKDMTELVIEWKLIEAGFDKAHVEGLSKKTAINAATKLAQDAGSQP